MKTPLMLLCVPLAAGAWLWWRGESAPCAPAAAAIACPKPLAETSCKPFAPIRIQLDARPEAGGTIALDYTLTLDVEAELLPVEFELWGGAQLLQHGAAPTGPTARGAAVRGSSQLRWPAGAAAETAGLELVARYSLPEPSSPGGFVVHERRALLGAPRGNSVAGLRSVQSGAQLSLDVPAERK